MFPTDFPTRRQRRLLIASLQDARPNITIPFAVVEPLVAYLFNTDSAGRGLSSAVRKLRLTNRDFRDEITRQIQSQTFSLRSASIQFLPLQLTHSTLVQNIQHLHIALDGTLNWDDLIPFRSLLEVRVSPLRQGTQNQITFNANRPLRLVRLIVDPSIEQRYTWYA